MQSYELVAESGGMFRGLEVRRGVRRGEGGEAGGGGQAGQGDEGRGVGWWLWLQTGGDPTIWVACSGCDCDVDDANDNIPAAFDESTYDVEVCV